MPSLARSVSKPLKVPSLACSVPKPLKVPNLARSVPKLSVGEAEGLQTRHYHCCRPLPDGRRQRRYEMYDLPKLIFDSEVRVTTPQSYRRQRGYEYRPTLI